MTGTAAVLREFPTRSGSRPSLGRSLPCSLKWALAAEVPFSWFTADEAYGQAGYLREWLEEHDVHYVMATRRDDRVTTRAGRSDRIDALVAEMAAASWQRLSVGAGAHGPREYDWVRKPIDGTWAKGRGHWLLARRSMTPNSKGELEIAYYLCYGPKSSRLVDLAWAAGSRWHIEEAFQQAKNEAGLDHYQVRAYRAWYAHITLSMLALAWLAAARAEAAKGNQSSR